MGKSDFLARQRAMQQGFFNAGVQSGRQQILDMVSLVLRDPDIMGKDTFGKERLLKVIQGVNAKIDLYQKRTMKPIITGRSWMPPLLKHTAKECTTLS